MDKFAALEARMSASSAGSFAAPESISIGFLGTRELSQSAADTASPCVGSQVSSTSADTMGQLGGVIGSQKRKRVSTEGGGDASVAARTPSPRHQSERATLHSGSSKVHSPPPVQGPVPVMPPPTTGLDGASMTAGASPACSSGARSARQQQGEEQQQLSPLKVGQLEAELLRSKQLATERANGLEEAREALRVEQESSSLVRTELEQSKAEVEAARSAIAGMRTEIAAIRTEQEQERDRQNRGREALRSALRERCFRARAEAKERLARESVRLGTLEPDGKAFSTGWVQKDGSALVQLRERERDQELRRAALEEDRKVLRKRKPKAGGGGSAGSDRENSFSAEGLAEATDAAIELADFEESLNLRGSLLTKERAELAAERKQLEREAQDHFHELRLMQVSSAATIRHPSALHSCVCNVPCVTCSLSLDVIVSCRAPHVHRAPRRSLSHWNPTGCVSVRRCRWKVLCTSRRHRRVWTRVSRRSALSFSI
jgi:hypothetical protein